MRIRLTALVLVLLALPSFAALQYDFVQKNTTADPVEPTSDLSARATIDGVRSRIDILDGTVYPPGTFVISNDGSQRLYYVDPSKRWYTEVNASGVATALGASNLRISNVKSELVRHEDRPLLLGIETDHTTLRLSYDITVSRGAIPVTSHVETDIESWTTTKFGDVLENSALSISRTGKAELDRLIAEETALKGFPLRQTVTTRATFQLRPTNSELKVPPGKTIIREMRVTALRELPAEASLFNIPAGYRRADTPEVPLSSTKILDFEPPSK